MKYTAIGIAGRIVLILIIITGSAASEIFPGALTGVRLGINRAGVTGHVGNPESRTGYCLGGFINYPQNDFFSLQIELLATGKGYTVPDTVLYADGQGAGRIKWTAIVSYIEIPILAKCRWPGKSKYKPYIIGGPFLAMPVRKKVRLADQAFVFDLDLTQVVTLDAGFIYGLGIDLKTGNGMLFFETRYDTSLIKLLNKQDQKNKTLSFQIGYRF